MPMTNELKEQRKAATTARSRAYSARVRELREAEGVGEAEIEARFADDIKANNDAERALLAERDAAITEINRQIDALKAKRVDLEGLFSPTFNRARQISKGIYDQRRQAQIDLQNALDEKFSDLCGAARWSAAAWKPIEEFL